MTKKPTRMTTRRAFLRSTLTASVAVALLTTLALPTPAAADRMDELQDRFERRYRDVRRLKDDGTVGETAGGFLEGVKGGLAGDEARVVEEENADRRELYALIGRKENTSPDVVARQNALRNFRKAQRGDWLKGENGKWVQKR